MRMIPISARCTRENREHIVVRGSRRDRVERAAILVGREVNAVPVNGGRLRKLVHEVDDDFVALVNLERRARNLSVVGEYVRALSRNQRKPRRLGDEIHFDSPWRRRNVLEERRRKKRIAWFSAGGTGMRPRRGFEPEQSAE